MELLAEGGDFRLKGDDGCEQGAYHRLEGRDLLRQGLQGRREFGRWLGSRIAHILIESHSPTNGSTHLNGYAWATFTYDPAGNLTSKWHQGESPRTFVNDNSNRIRYTEQGSDNITITYDPTGNLIAEFLNGVCTTYEYDQENRLVCVVDDEGKRSTYCYAGGLPERGEGLRRSAVQSLGEITTFIWDGQDYLGEY